MPPDCWQTGAEGREPDAALKAAALHSNLNSKLFGSVHSLQEAAKEVGGDAGCDYCGADYQLVCGAEEFGLVAD